MTERDSDPRASPDGDEASQDVPPPPPSGPSPSESAGSEWAPLSDPPFEPPDPQWAPPSRPEPGAAPPPQWQRPQWQQDIPEKPTSSGRRVLLVLGGIIVALVLVAATVAVALQLRGAGRDDAGAVTREGTMSVMDLRVGDCFNDPGSGVEIDEVEAVPCSQLHDNEIFHIGELPDPPDATYPGEDAVFEDAAARCLDLFPTFVGKPYETSALDIWVLSPSPKSWALGDRDYVCSAYDPGGRVQGTLESSGR